MTWGQSGVTVLVPNTETCQPYDMKIRHRSSHCKWYKQDSCFRLCGLSAFVAMNLAPPLKLHSCQFFHQHHHICTVMYACIIWGLKVEDCRVCQLRVNSVIRSALGTIQSDYCLLFRLYNNNVVRKSNQLVSQCFENWTIVPTRWHI